MGWFTKKKSRSDKPLFTVGDYEVNCSLSNLPTREYLRIASIPEGQFSFIGEHVYACPNVTAFNREWTLVIGVVDDQIYKIALTRASEDRLSITEDLNEVFVFCRNVYGEPAEEQALLAVWDAADGNVVVQTNAPVPRQDQYVIMVFLTSSIVKTFRVAAH